MTLSHSRHTFLYPVAGRGRRGLAGGPRRGVRLLRRRAPAGGAGQPLRRGGPPRPLRPPPQPGLRRAGAALRLAGRPGPGAPPAGQAPRRARQRLRPDQLLRRAAAGRAAAGGAPARRPGGGAWRWPGGASTARPASAPWRPSWPGSRRRCSPCRPRPWERAVWTSAVVHPDCHLRAGGAVLLGALPLRRAPAGRAAGRAHGGRLRRPAAGDQPTPGRPGGGPPAPSTTPRRGGPTCGGRPRPACSAPPPSARPPARWWWPCSRRSPLTRLREVHALLRLAEAYPAARLERACRAGPGRRRRALPHRPRPPRARPGGPAARPRPAAGRGRAGLPARPGRLRRAGGRGGGGGAVVTLDLLLPRLRQLKLSGMRDSIAARAEEARAQGAGPAGVRPAAGRRRAGPARGRRRPPAHPAGPLRGRLRPARLRLRLQPRDPQGPPVGAGHRAASSRSTPPCCSAARPASGKTFVAQALGLETCRRQRSVLFTKTERPAGRPGRRAGRRQPPAAAAALPQARPAASWTTSPCAPTPTPRRRTSTRWSAGATAAGRWWPP